MKNKFRKMIIAVLLDSGKDGLSEGKLLNALGTSKKDKKRVLGVCDALERDNIIGYSKGKVYLKGYKKYFEGEITRVSKSFGFVANEKNGEECFVTGKMLRGAVPGDRVLAKITEFKNENNRSDTAEVVLILEESEAVLTGTIVSENGELKLEPYSFVSREPLFIHSYGGNSLKAGDKVQFKLHERSEHHSEHTVDIVSVYGNAELAKVSVDAYIDEKSIHTEFPEEAITEAKKIELYGIKQSEIDSRLDLRRLPIFTIDGADTKDIDDAISIEKTADGFKLGVHIADVSYYVKKGSSLDKEAFQRGTSIYIADRVIPMLPKELSNGICSLNPQTDRLAFSCLMDIAENGEIKKFKFVKTVIRSRVQGVYKEINAILDGSADEAVKAKYSEVLNEIPVMNQLAAILQRNRENRGAPEIDTVETKIICDENGRCIDIKPRERGVSEGIIEEFMLCANNCAAKLAMEEEFPFVYRIHEAPASEKLVQLGETLTLMGADSLGINEKSTAGDLANILKKAKDDPKYQIINKLVLRTMMKAKYSEVPVGHFGLVMKEYAHFTSPIRRLADLSIHRILSDYVNPENRSKLNKRYTKFAAEAALRASNTELVAVNAERDCDKFYMAEYIKKHIGEEFDGIISGVINNGFFVELPNTVEGRVDTTALPTGIYEVQNNIALVDTLSGKAYTIGDPVKIVVAGANVSSGLIDFALKADS